MDKIISDILSIIGRFLDRINSKRLAAFALLLIYFCFLFYNVQGKAAVSSMDIILIEGVLFVVIPAIIFAILISSLTIKGGGDGMEKEKEEEKPKTVYSETGGEHVEVEIKS